MISEMRKTVGNYILIGAIAILAIAEWNEYEWYLAVNPYGTLFASLALAACFFCYVNIKDALKDPVFYLMIVTDVIAVVNTVLAHSGYGAILTAADFLLICYLANKVAFDRKQTLIISGFLAFFFFYWTIDVKGYFKGYNTNYGGLVLITGFIFLMILMEIVRLFLEKKGGRTAAIGKWAWYVVMLAFLFVGYKIIAWYRSRCALIGFLVVVIMMLIPKKWWKSRVFYLLATLATTAGAVLVSAIYVWLALIRDRFQLQIFYKDILSGREELWQELWDAYLLQPMIGIGTRYQVQVDFMEGLFEVHNGFLDLLFVHGLVVFLVACVFFIFRMLKLRETIASDSVAKYAFAALAAMLVTSFFENYMIVPPYSIIVLVLFAIINGRTMRKEENLI